MNPFRFGKFALLRLHWLLLEHIRVCYNNFDPVYIAPVTVRTRKQLMEYRKIRFEGSKWKHKLFMVQFLIPLLFLLEFGYILHQHDWHYFTEPMPELLSHRVFHEMFWRQGDLILIFASVCSLIVNWYLWRGQWLDDRFCMYFVYDGAKYRLVAGGLVWDDEISEKVLQYRNKSLRKMKLFALITYSCAQCYFQYFLRSKGLSGVYYQLQCYVFLPLLIWNVAFALMFMFYHFFIVSNYVIMKQSYMIRQQEQLAQALQTADYVALPALNARFWKLNKKLAYICNEIGGYNHFWSIYFTSQFMCNLALFCYFLYCIIFMDATVLEIIYFVYYMVEYAVLIFMVIYRCSLIDQNNDRAYALNMKTNIWIQLRFGHLVVPKVLANLETIASNRNFSRCCFRLINGYRMDSTAFNFAMYIVSTFFLMLCRQTKRNQYYRK